MNDFSILKTKRQKHSSEAPKSSVEAFYILKPCNCNLTFVAMFFRIFLLYFRY